MDLHGRSLLKEIDFTREEFLSPGRPRRTSFAGAKRLGLARAPAGRPEHRADLREGLDPDQVRL